MRKTILATVSAAAIALTAAMPAGAADAFKGDNSACWGDNDRQDISCVRLTAEFLMNLRFKTKAEIQKLMNAAGRPIPNRQRIELHFISNYTRGAEEGSGYVNVQFGDDGKAVIITADVDAANSASTAAKFIWSAYHLPKGCYSKPSTVTMFCKLKPEEELAIVLHSVLGDQ
jgi:hypothetical protein